MARAPPSAPSPRAPAYASTPTVASPATGLSKSRVRPIWARMSSSVARPSRKAPVPRPACARRRGGCPSEAVRPPASGGRAHWALTSRALPSETAAVKTLQIASCHRLREVPGRKRRPRSESSGRDVLHGVDRRKPDAAALEHPARSAGNNDPIWPPGRVQENKRFPLPHAETQALSELEVFGGQRE